MTPERWRAIEELFNKVAGRPPQEQAAELANVEPGLRYEVEKLRCSACGHVFTASLPEAAGEEKYSPRARAVLACS